MLQLIINLLSLHLHTVLNAKYSSRISQCSLFKKYLRIMASTERALAHYDVVTQTETRPIQTWGIWHISSFRTIPHQILLCLTKYCGSKTCHRTSVLFEWGGGGVTKSLVMTQTNMTHKVRLTASLSVSVQFIVHILKYVTTEAPISGTKTDAISLQ